MVRILLTDGEQRSTLAATRSLGRAGHEVWVCSREPKPLAGASRFCRGSWHVADPGTGPGLFVAEVERRSRAAGVDVIVPMTDVSGAMAPALRAALPGTRVLFPQREVYEAVSDKAGLLAAAAALGVPAPRQVTLSSQAGAVRELEAVAASFPWPLVLKPARSAVQGASGVEKFGVRVAADLGQAKDLLGRYPASAYPVLAQELIHGQGLGAFALFWDGEPYAWFAHRRLREKPPTGGVSVYRESVPLREDLKEHATRILRHFRWSGVAMVEFKEDAATGTPYLMEVNGRFWGSLQLAVDAGVDFPALLVALACGEGATPVDRYRAGIRSRWLWGDVDHLLSLVRRGATLRATHPELPGALGALGRFAVPWRPGDRFEVLRPSDPLPFLRESAHWFRGLRG